MHVFTPLFMSRQFMKKRVILKTFSTWKKHSIWTRYVNKLVMINRSCSKAVLPFWFKNIVKRTLTFKAGRSHGVINNLGLPRTQIERF